MVGLAPLGMNEKSLQLPLVTIKSSESQSSVTPDVSPNEAAIEKTLGRKRCIMFACGGQKAAMKTEPEPPKPAEVTEKPKRKCMLTFACPLRTDKKDSLVSEILESRPGSDSQARKPSVDLTMSESAQTTKTIIPTSQTQAIGAKLDHQISPAGFHEFGNSVDEPDAWVDKPIDQQRRLTLTDCLRKENAIRQLGEEAEEEAEAEDADDNGNEDADEDVNEEDDFAPSDDGADDGNESDDEEGFADSDDESNADSEDRFWAPSTTTAQTSMTNISILRSRSHQRSPASSLESSSHLSRLATNDSVNRARRHRAFKAPKMRPGTQNFLTAQTLFAVPSMKTGLLKLPISHAENKRSVTNIYSSLKTSTPASPQVTQTTTTTMTMMLQRPMRMRLSLVGLKTLIPGVAGRPSTGHPHCRPNIGRLLH